MNDLTATCSTQWNTLLQTLHQSPFRLALVAAGGGTGAIAKCFQRPGASQSFVEAVIPYSHAAMQDYLGEPPEQGSASIETAEQLAKRACRRARSLLGGPAGVTEPVGLALVAALPTNAQRRGGDRIHVVVQSAERVSCYSLDLGKDQFTRAAAELIGDELLFSALANLVGGPHNEAFFLAAGLQPTIASTPCIEGGR